MVALQIHGVSEPTRRTLSAEARARGESLQEYLLDILDREVRDLGERRSAGRTQFRGGSVRARQVDITRRGLAVPRVRRAASGEELALSNGSLRSQR